MSRFDGLPNFCDDILQEELADLLQTDIDNAHQAHPDLSLDSMVGDGTAGQATPYFCLDPALRNDNASHRHPDEPFELSPINDLTNPQSDQELYETWMGLPADQADLQQAFDFSPMHENARVASRKEPLVASSNHYHSIEAIATPDADHSMDLEYRRQLHQQARLDQRASDQTHMHNLTVGGSFAHPSTVHGQMRDAAGNQIPRAPGLNQHSGTSRDDNFQAHPFNPTSPGTYPQPSPTRPPMNSAGVGPYLPYMAQGHRIYTSLPQDTATRSPVTTAQPIQPYSASGVPMFNGAAYHGQNFTMTGIPSMSNLNEVAAMNFAGSQRPHGAPRYRSGEAMNPHSQRRAETVRRQNYITRPNTPISAAQHQRPQNPADENNAPTLHQRDINNVFLDRMYGDPSKNAQNYTMQPPSSMQGSEFDLSTDHFLTGISLPSTGMQNRQCDQEMASKPTAIASSHVLYPHPTLGGPSSPTPVQQFGQGPPQCEVCGANYRPMRNEPKEKRHCKRHWDSYLKSQIPPKVYIMSDEISNGNAARDEVFKAVLPLDIQDDDCKEQIEDRWVQRFITAINKPYIGDEHTEEEYGAREWLLQQQKEFNMKPHQESSIQRQSYTDRAVTARARLLFMCVRTYHEGGVPPYPVGGDNWGYSEDRGLKCSTRLEQIEKHLSIDKRICMNVIEGRGVHAFAQSPQNYLTRKNANSRSNTKKRTYIAAGKAGAALLETAAAAGASSDAEPAGRRPRKRVRMSME